MDRMSRTRLAYEALQNHERDQVDAMLAPSLSKGWIPKPADLEAAIAQVVRPRQPV